MILVACGHPAPPKPPPAQLPAATAADLQGAWVADDDMAFYYAMRIGADGSIERTTDRGRLGKCAQKGTIKPSAQPRTFAVAFRYDECDRAAADQPRVLTVESFTSEGLTVTVSGVGDGLAERHAYKRDPKSDATPQPPQ